MSDPRTLAVYNSQTEKYSEMMEAEAKRDPMIERFITACSTGGRVLDLGCGPGHYARRMAEAGLQVDAIDASDAMIERAVQIPGIDARMGRFEDVTGQDIYDGVWAYFSLLHASRCDLPAHLRRIGAALKPGGVFFIGMKRGDGGKRDRLDRYYEYYERDELETLLQDAGMTATEHWTGRASGLSGHPEGWIVIKSHG